MAAPGGRGFRWAWWSRPPNPAFGCSPMSTSPGSNMCGWSISNWTRRRSRPKSRGVAPSDDSGAGALVRRLGPALGAGADDLAAGALQLDPVHDPGSPSGDPGRPDGRGVLLGGLPARPLAGGLGLRPPPPAPTPSADGRPAPPRCP